METHEQGNIGATTGGEEVPRTSSDPPDQLRPYIVGAVPCGRPGSTDPPGQLPPYIVGAIPCGRPGPPCGRPGQLRPGPPASARPLHLDASTFRVLLELQGPSLGLWRAAEIAALREQVYERPILDLGCGDGLVTSMVLSRVEIGLDPDEKVLARAAQLGIYERFEALPAEEAQLADGSIGTVISNSVLEHLPHVDGVLERVARVLRPGGRLIFTVPTDAFSRWLALPFACYGAWRNRQLRHLNLWSIERWKSQLARVGLEVQEVHPYLRRELVSLWDALELLQQIWISRRRLVGIVWRRIPPLIMDKLAIWASHLDLSAPAPGGGRLIVARKPL